MRELKTHQQSIYEKLTLMINKIEAKWMREEAIDLLDILIESMQDEQMEEVKWND